MTKPAKGKHALVFQKNKAKDFREIHFETFRMTYEKLELLINGKWTKGTSDKSQPVISTGMFGVNHFGIATPETPFGGVNHSGYGSEGGEEGIAAYQRVKFISEIGV
jgi:hypothetical protein